MNAKSRLIEYGKLTLLACHIFHTSIAVACILHLKYLPVSIEKLEEYQTLGRTWWRYHAMVSLLAIVLFYIIDVIPIQNAPKVVRNSFGLTAIFGSAAAGVLSPGWYHVM
ncbi:MAG: hypothetical protein AB7Q00_05440 [Phycisphaerales bacterium]